MAERSVDDVLASSRQMLELARRAVEDFQAGRDRRLAGLYNAVTCGRSVTFTLQNLRSRIVGFDDWYEPVRQRLRGDPIARWFHELRNRIEKEGTAGAMSASTHIAHLNTDDLARAAPPGTTMTFLGDSLGRSGWVVTLPDGTTRTLYFTLPPAMGWSHLHVEDAPDGRSMDELLPEWLALLESIVADAERTFATAP